MPSRAQKERRRNQRVANRPQRRQQQQASKLKSRQQTARQGSRAARKTTKPLREMTKRARRAEKKDDGGGGGVLGGLGRAVGGSIGEALEILDVPGSVVRNAVAGGVKSIKDVATGEGDGGDLLRALAMITPAGGLGAGGIGVQASDEQVRKDIKRHTGVGEHLERAGIDDVPVLSNDWSKRALGFAGDVALDPLSYLAPAAKLSGGARAVSKRVLDEGAERTAGRLAREAGLESADDARRFVAGQHASTTAARNPIREEAEAIAGEAATRVRAKGASSLSEQEARDLLGTPGGVQFRVPGTGRVARGVGLRKGPTLEATVVPKALTDPISRSVAAGVRAPRGTRLGAILGEHFSGANPEILDAARSGDPERAVPAMKFESAARTTRQGAEHLGQQKLDEYAGLRQGFRGHEDDLVDTLEGSEDAARRLAAAGVDPEPMRQFLSGLYDEAEAAGIPIQELDSYFPRMLRDEARDAVTKSASGRGRGFDPTKGRTLTAEKMGLDEGASQSAVRAEVERFARDELGLPDGFYEKNPDKVLPIYIQSIARRIGRQNLIGRMQGDDIVKRAAEPVEIPATGAQRGTKKGGALGRQIARGEEDVARLADEASQQRSAASTLGEQPSVTPAVTDTSVDAVKAELQQALKRGGFKPAGRGVFKMTDLSTAAEGSIAAELRASAEASATDVERILADANALGLRGSIERRGDDIVVDLTEGFKPQQDAVPAAARSDAAVDLTLDAASAQSVRIADNADELEAAAAQTESLLEGVRAGMLNGDARLAEREELLESSAGLLRAAQAEQDPVLRRVAVLEAKANEAEAAALEVSGQVDKLQTKLGALKTTRMVKRQIQEIKDGAYEMLAREADPQGAGLAAPKDIAEALNRVDKVLTPEGMRGFLEHYDKLIAYIKAWQVTTPGFHVRNFMGGAFNNYVADIDLGAYRRWRRVRKSVESGKGKATAAERAAYEQVKSVVGRGQYSPHELTTGLKHERLRTRLNPLSSRNAVVRGSMRAGGGVEELLRGALGMDVMLKGSSLDDATESIAKFHFDYGDLSGAEQTLKRRVIPFYTWTRKNLPLQIEMMALRPGKYSKYYQAKLEVEQGTPEEGLVPQYFTDLLGIRTPMSYGGGQIYAMPDLPFTRSITETLPFDPEGFDPTKPLGMLSPVLKTPIERAMGHQFFKDIPFTDKYAEAPAAWQRVPGLMEALSVIGEAKKVNGEWQMQDRAAYTVEQYLPLLGRMRRQAPSEKKFQDRALTTWLSFFGAPLRTNTKAEQNLEKFRRSLDAGKTEKVFVKKGRKAVTVSNETLRRWDENR